MAYRIEGWDPLKNQYYTMWESRYANIERAEIMFNKPYIKFRTRRLIKISEETLYKEKADKYLSK